MLIYHRRPQKIQKYLTKPRVCLVTVSFFFLKVLASIWHPNKSDVPVAPAGPLDIKLLGLPKRLRRNFLKGEILGQHLSDIKEGSFGVHKALYGIRDHAERSESPPMTIEEILLFFSNFLRRLHDKFEIMNKRAKPSEIWAVYHELVKCTLYPWVRV